MNQFNEIKTTEVSDEMRQMLEAIVKDFEETLSRDIANKQIVEEKLKANISSDDYADYRPDAINNKSAIAMYDFEDPSKDKVRYFDNDDACFDEFRHIIYYWNNAAAKDKSYNIEFPEGEYFYEDGREQYDPGDYMQVFHNGKVARLYIVSLVEFPPTK